MTGMFRHWPTRLRSVVVLAAALVMAGCAYIRDPEPPMTIEQVEELTPMAQVPVARAWVNPPGSQLVFQRGLLGGSEQRVLLVNQSAMPGDNQMVIRTRTGFGDGGRLRYEEFIRRVGGLPAPFQNASSGAFQHDADDLGPYAWAEERFGVGTICVLAVRRVQSAGRHLPAGVDAMDILLRNCVNGTAAKALEPILAPSVSGGPLGAPAGGSSRMLSALAGPSQ
ncbi:hypothetical protein [Gemmobacter sp.]|uniref:hypothetical protein n=1 Tax=Gemmobacter sp. TaxID=1898957 RepID=UPI002AFE638B|nr:hypothetical protein [Gemmobacter sp.]